MMRRICMLAAAAALLLALAGCGEQGKIDGVKKTVLPNCNGQTMEGLASTLVQNPVWGLEKDNSGKESVTLKGTLVGDKLPAWVKEQKLMDITFRFALDPKTDKYDPAALDGFPSLTEPEGIFQVYKTLVCQ